MHQNGIVRIFNRRKEETAAARVLASGRKRVGHRAEGLMRNGAIRARAELVNGVVAKFIHDLYQPDDDGTACNFDAGTGMLNVAAPWGSTRHRDYGLRRSEANTLRAYLRHLARQRHPVPLFTFDFRWYVNVFDYPDLPRAMHYWQLVEIDVGTWKRFFRP